MGALSGLLMFAAGLSGTAQSARTRIDVGVLLDDMIRLTRLMEWSHPAYKTVQFSSYDRTSNLPGGPGWFANNDGFGRETTPNFEAVARAPGEDGIGEYVICDVPGPGAIVRTWTAGIGGKIRLYLDGAEEPLYDGPAAEFLSCPYRAWAEAADLDPAIFDDSFEQRQASYCPIPFARHCRMVWIGDVQQTHFYHVQIRQYEPAASVQTFTPEDLKTYASQVREVARILRHPAKEYAFASQETPVEIKEDVPAGQKREVLRLDGPGAVERLTLKLSAADMNRALRQTILHIYCDDAPRGQVQAPVGDFFGAAPGINPFDSLPFTVQPDGTMTCRWAMPFKSSLRIVLDNRGDQAVSATGSALPMKYAWDDDSSMYLTARWRVHHGVPAAPDDVHDLPFLVARGTGRYVGTAVLLLNPCDVPTPYGGWWGEGDEKVFVDDDTFPSTFGTGSEDYFNYAWSMPDLFSYAYCGQPRCDGPGNRGFVTNDRWHILDDLPFRSSIAFYMELYPHDHVTGMSYASLAYAYARPGMVDDHVAISDEDVRPPVLPPTWTPAARMGMRNSVYYDAEKIATGTDAVTSETGPLWSGGKLLVWKPAGPGAELTLRFPIAEDGKYAVHVGFRQDKQAGNLTFKLDGKPVEFSTDGALSLYEPYHTLARQHGAEVGQLAAGQHELTLVFKGAEPAVAEPTIGVDYLAVQKRH